MTPSHQSFPPLNDSVRRPGAATTQAGGAWVRVLHRMGGGVHWLTGPIGAYVLIGLAWGVLFRRIIPRPFSDRGVFISVGERLLAGDRLYVDVYDNKDPLFFYLVALGRAISPLMDLVIEAALIAACSVAVYIIACRIVSGHTALIVSWGAVPLLLVSSNYMAGFTHLPGIALTLAALAAASRGDSWLAGVFGGLLVMMKLPMTPLPAIAILCQLAFDRKSVSLPRIVAGGLLVCLGVMAIMWFRGELSAYGSVVAGNVAYAESGSQSESLLGKMADHLWRSYTPEEGFKIGLIIVGLGFGLGESLKGPASRYALSSLLLVYTTATFASAILVLALTGMWQHHAQVLHVPAALALVLMAPAYERWRGRGYALAGIAVVLFLVCLKAVLLNGPEVRQSFSRLMYPPTESILLREQGPTGAYARLGLNDDDPGHAAGLRGWKLVCPRFHQYDFESAAILKSVIDCASTAPFILLSSKFRETPGHDVFNDYVREANKLVVSYKCVSKHGVRVCHRPP